jgi:hypothetical protein
MQSVYFLIAALISLVSCQEQQHKLQRMSDVNGTAESVYLTRDHNNAPVIVWTENDQKEINFYYAVSDDGGITFTNKLKVPVQGQFATHAEGMPKVAFKKDGTVIAAYEQKAPTKENKYAGSIYYMQSLDHGKTWSDPKFMHSDTVAGRSRSYFDIQTLADGEIGAVWLDAKLKGNKGGRSVRFAKTSGRKGFTNEILIDSSACECCRIDLHADASNTSIAYRGLMTGNMGQPIRDMMFTSSSDAGKNFSAPLRISADNWAIDGCPHTGPSLCSSNQGLQALWYTQGSGNGIYYAHTSDPYNGFSPREGISMQGRHPQISFHHDQTLLVWEEDLGDDKKSVTRIRFQLKDASNERRDFLSPKQSNAFLPVVTEGKNGFVIAFLMEDKNGVGVYITSL